MSQEPSEVLSEPPVTAVPEGMTDTAADSKKQILKSTGILGSVQVINIVIGIIRTKVLAVLLGPIGVGISGIYQSTVSLIGSATGFGIGFSGVRDIASAVASGDEVKTATAVKVLRRWSWFTGLLGMVLAIAFARPLSIFAFGDASYANGIRIVSVTLLLSALTSGIGSLLQGSRKISSIAKANMMSAVLGLITVTIVYYLLGIKGIIPAIILTALLNQFALWYFGRSVKTINVQLSLRQTFTEGLSMVKLGFFIVITSFFSNGIMYIIRAFISHKGEIENVGEFIAAWTISTMYISAIFNSMGADYYPRLSAVHGDATAVNKLVNEQTEVAMLLTTPIIIGMVSFIDLVVKIFYAKGFAHTAEILHWQLLGDFFKVLSWPMGFVLVAKAKGKLFIITELSWNLLYLAMIYFSWDYFGLKVSGIAFLLAYILFAGMLYFILFRMTGFRWSKAVLKYMAIFIPALAVSFIGHQFLSIYWQYFLGGMLTIGSAVFSFYQLKEIINFSAVLKRFKIIK